MAALLAHAAGLVYHKLGNLDKATHHFRLAITTDVFCYEALEILLEYHLLSAADERLLFQSLDFQGQCGPDAELVRALYVTKLKKFDSVEQLNPSFELLRTRYGLSTNGDVLAAHAEALFYQSRFRQCHQVTSGVLERDSFHQGCLLTHIGCLYELNLKNHLFILSHQLIDSYPDRALSWFAVGVYYLLIGRNGEARRHLVKATTLDANFGPAWLAFGHSFAVDTETDPALAAYTTSARLLRGCHLPLLFIGMEHAKSNNPILADQYFTEALRLYPYDSLLLNERGVLQYRAGDIAQALRSFQDALELMTTTAAVSEGRTGGAGDQARPSLKACHLNLGHCYRKLRQYDLSTASYERALSIDPYCAASLSALGFVHQIQGRAFNAIECYHQSLALRPGDSFSSEMLSRALQEQLQRPIAQPNLDQGAIAAKVDSLVAGPPQQQELEEDDDEEEEIVAGGGGGAGDDDDDDDDMVIEE